MHTAKLMLLYNIDHQVLAAAARTFAANTGWEKSGSKHNGYYVKGDDVSLPASIRVLKPTSVLVFDDRIEIEFGGALHHQGISVFREASGGQGTRNLGNGIWYYSEQDKISE